MRVAWFSPMPPVRSGIAAYTAEVVPALRPDFGIDIYSETNAYDFVWMNRRAPYDLVVYQLGNGPAHDFIWGYLARYPGLLVLHDARLHHARARLLLAAGRADDYRAEFRFNHPAVPPGAAEYAVEGLRGDLYYLWPMLRVPVATARMIAVHNARVAHDLSVEFPDAAIEAIRMGVPGPCIDPGARERIRRQFGIGAHDILFAAFGKITAEKRIDAVLTALATVNAEGARAHLVLVGESDDAGALASRIRDARLGGRVHVAGYVADEEIGAYLGAADACLCLRWPTALETSASWLRCLAASRATVLSDLAHLADVPDAVALRIDLLDEERQLADAMRMLAADPTVRERLARAGHEYWAATHTLEQMAGDYRRVIAAAAERPAPQVRDLPRHLVEDYFSRATGIARRFGVAPL